MGPRLFGKVGQGKLATAKAQIALFESALDQYKLDVGQYPATGQGRTWARVRPAPRGRPET